MLYGETQTTGPTCEPLHITEAKANSVVASDFTDDDTWFARRIAAKRQLVERWTNRQLVTATWRLSLDEFPCSDEEIRLPRNPVQSITSVQYVDTDGATQTLSASRYVLSTDREPARLACAYGYSWPATRTRYPGAVKVNYIAGYATPITANATTDVLTASGRTFADGDIVRLTNSGGSLPTGLAINTDYYVRDSSGSTFKLSASSGGSATDITGAGSGYSFVGEIPEAILEALLVEVSHRYENREGADGEDKPRASDWLLMPYCIPLV